MLEQFKSNKKVVGARQTIKAINSGLAKLVVIARDADERVVGGIKELCAKNNVTVEYIDTMKQLGKECNIDVGAAVACVLKEDM